MNQKTGFLVVSGVVTADVGGMTSIFGRGLVVVCLVVVVVGLGVVVVVVVCLVVVVCVVVVVVDGVVAGRVLSIRWNRVDVLVVIPSTSFCLISSTEIAVLSSFSLERHTFFESQTRSLEKCPVVRTET